MQNVPGLVAEIGLVNRDKRVLSGTFEIESEIALSC